MKAHGVMNNKLREYVNENNGTSQIKRYGIIQIYRLLHKKRPTPSTFYL